MNEAKLSIEDQHLVLIATKPLGNHYWFSRLWVLIRFTEKQIWHTSVNMSIFNEHDEAKLSIGDKYLDICISFL